MKINKGFTLIELMVVISIVGFLSSIVLVSVQGVSEKARFAAAMKFYKHTQAVLFDKGAYVFNFDNQNYVSSGLYSNSATSIPASGPVPDTTLFKSGYNFSAAYSHYPGIGLVDSNIANIANGYDFTLGTWYKPTAIGNNNAPVIALGTNVPDITDNAIYINSIKNVCVRTNPSSWICSNMKVEIGKWHYLVAVFKNIDSSNVEVGLYVDGKPFKAVLPASSVVSTYTRLSTSGPCCAASFVASGLYDEVVLSDITF
jgi:prepilin-type N-terminal cleavage/methylation domain-containing protein